MKNGKIFKQAAAVFTAAVMAVSLFATAFTVKADDTQEVRAATQSALQNAVNAAAESGVKTVIVITRDITLSGTTNKNNQIKVPEGADVTVRSASGGKYTITENSAFGYDSSARHGVFEVNGSLTLEDITVNANGMGRGIVVNNNACVRLSSGTLITGGAENYNSGAGLGVYVAAASKASKGGVLYIEDGAEISGNTASYEGGSLSRGIGVYVGDYGKLFMTGGKITDNHIVTKPSTTFVNAYSCPGGGIAGKYATMVISGGEISDNSGLEYGGGLFIESGCSVTVSGDAKIINNSASSEGVEFASSAQGGGIYITGGVLNIEENALISGNIAASSASARFKACGAGIYIDNGTVNMKGGTISDNEASFNGADITSDDEDTMILIRNYPEGCGAGVFLEGGTFNMSAGTITNNRAFSDRDDSTAQGNGGGLYLGFTNGNGGSVDPETYGTANITGGTISGNSASCRGADVYLADGVVSRSGGIGVRNNGTATVGFIAGTVNMNISGALNIGELYLPAPFTGVFGSAVTSAQAAVCITGSLAGAEVGLMSEDAEEGRVIALPSSSYVPVNTDAAAIKPLDPGFVCKTDSTGSVFLSQDTGDSLTDISSAFITVKDCVYSGFACESEVTVTYDGTELTEGEDYSVSYINNTAVGKAAAIISGYGAYTGTVKREFNVAACDIASESVLAAAVTDVYYTGNPVTASVSLSLNGTSLAQGTDYDLSFEDNTEAGRASAVITGKGNFTGSRKIEFNIVDSTGKTIVSDEEGLRSALALETAADEPEVIILSQDITITAPLAAAQGLHADIYGNGASLIMGSAAKPTADDPGAAMLEIPGGSIGLYNITLDAKSNARCIYVAAGASLYADSSVILTRGATVTKGTKALGGQVIKNEGTVRFCGTIENSSSVNRYFGAVYNGGSFTLKEGSVIRNVITASGGAVFNDKDAEFTMEGGIITASATTLSNGIPYGNAVSNLGTFTMTGGSITGNSASAPAVYSSGIFVMEGGAISDNSNTIGTTNASAKQYGTSGGGVKLLGGSFTMNGGEISRNGAIEGGGVIITYGTFILNDGSISHNTAYCTSTDNDTLNFGNGGGILISGGRFEMNGGEISGNTADYTSGVGRTEPWSGHGAGIFLYGGTAAIAGGAISGNTGSEQGKYSNGIYFGKTYVNDSKKVSISSSADGRLEISAAPRISDDIYIESGNVLHISGALTDAVINVRPEVFGAGTALAVYDEGVEIKAQDAEKFIVNGQKGAVRTDEASRSIKGGLTDISMCTITVDPSEYTYTGSAIIPRVTVTDQDGNAVTGYSITAEDNISPGEKTAVITGDGYAAFGESVCTFTITKTDLSSASVYVSLEKNSFDFNGSAITPKVTVLASRKELVKGTDYTVEYKNNTLPGTAEVIISALEDSNFTGTAQKTFTIRKNDALKDTVIYLDGVWTYIDDEFSPDYTFTGIRQNSNGWWYVENGVVTFAADTVASNENGWWKITDSRVDFSFTGFADNAYGRWRVENGKVNFGYEDIALDENEWRYYYGGRYRPAATGFADNSYGRWRVENGKDSFNYNDIVYESGEWRYYYGGRFRNSYTGVTDCANSYGWWYVKNGAADFSTNTVAANSNGWWKVTGGKVDFNFNGLASNSNGWWYIKGGKVDFNFNGLASNSNGTWVIKNGRADFGCNGSYEYNGKTYNVKDGRVQ